MIIPFMQTGFIPERVEDGLEANKKVNITEKMLLLTVES